MAFLQVGAAPTWAPGRVSLCHQRRGFWSGQLLGLDKALVSRVLQPEASHGWWPTVWLQDPSRGQKRVPQGG